MVLGERKPALVLSGVVLFYLAMAELFLAALPQPREPLQYMVAGAFATAVSLLVAFVLYATGRIAPETILRTVRRSGQSS
jgi:multisubunit Na+/H+ antiporter MnhB subunit